MLEYIFTVTHECVLAGFSQIPTYSGFVTVTCHLSSQGNLCQSVSQLAVIDYRQMGCCGGILIIPVGRMCHFKAWGGWWWWGGLFLKINHLFGGVRG